MNCLLKALNTRDVTLKTGSVTWYETRIQGFLDGLEPAKRRDSSMTTLEIHQAKLWFLKKNFLHISTICTFVNLSIVLFSSGHFLSLVPSEGNQTTADLISPIFLPSQTCQVPKTLLLDYVERCGHSLTIPPLPFFHSTVEFLPLHWRKTWTCSGFCPE